MSAKNLIGGIGGSFITSVTILGYIINENQKNTLRIRKNQVNELISKCETGGCKEFYEQQLQNYQEWNSKDIWSFSADYVPPVQRY